MRFLDANVFIYAYYKSRRRLDPIALAMKKIAKDIISKIESGEEKVVTTVVHLSEIANIIKYAVGIDVISRLLMRILELENVKVIGVDVEDYRSAVTEALLLNIDPNDSLAVITCRKLGIKEIITFDKDFDKVKDIKRIPSDEEILKVSKEFK